MALPLPNDMTKGAIHTSNSCGDVVVIECLDSYSVRIRFINTGNEVYASAGNIRKGSLKDKMIKTVYGVGYMGNGRHMAAIKGKRTKAYVAWGNMMSRCYSVAYKKNGKSYEGCTVHDDWHNFQNFAEWYEGNYVEGYEVDKDLLFIGNKIYSEKTCVLVPQWLNVFANSDKSIRGDCPVGVSERKGKGGFESYCNFEGKRIHLGVFSSKESAHNAWMEKKLNIALSKKIEMDLIDKRIYPNVVSIIKNM